MKKLHVVFHDAGGGHRNAAIALHTIAAQQQRPWQVELIHFQELTDQLDVLRKLTGIRIQEQYNILLRNGWTLGSLYLLRLLQTTIRVFHRPMLRLLENFWKEKPADLLVSVIPHFNRELCQSWSSVYPGRPFVTLITDLADFPPRFWIEPLKDQYVIAGTRRAAEQARALGHDHAHILRTSGMILRPDFYLEDSTDPVTVRNQLGLRPDLTTALVLFGGYGSQVMYEIAERLEAARLPVQLILVCGRNQKLAVRFNSRQWNTPIKVIGFTNEIPKLMRAADFLIGKPGPGSIAEAMVKRLPVLIECNAWTLPQERYNAAWVTENQVGIVLENFRQVVDGVTRMIDPAIVAKFRANVARLENRAIFEIPEILDALLKKSESARHLLEQTAAD